MKSISVYLWVIPGNTDADAEYTAIRGILHNKTKNMDGKIRNDGKFTCMQINMAGMIGIS